MKMGFFMSCRIAMGNRYFPLKRRDFLKNLIGASILFGIPPWALTGCLSEKKYTIIEYPDPSLRSIAKKIQRVNPEILLIHKRIISLLRKKALTGLVSKSSMPKGMAAPQIGVSKRLIVCGIHGRVVSMINPEIIDKSGTYSSLEGCLSLPHHPKKKVLRSGYVRIKYSSVENKKQTLEAKDRYAAVIEHEIDHLNGRLYIDLI